MNDHVTYPGGKVRLYVEAPLAEGVGVEASDSQAHYLLNVMRARAGGRVLLFNGRDGEWRARIVEAARGRCAFACEAQTRPQQSTPDLWLCLAPVKRTPTHYIVQKGTELGVSALQPVITRRTVVSRVNTERMRANAIEAAEQSDRLQVPEVRKPLSLEKLLMNWPAGRPVLFCDEAGEAPPIVEALFGPTSRGQLWGILTGPEGGFDPTERETIRSHSFVIPVSLGPRILRADTAGLAATAIWQALKGDWR